MILAESIIERVRGIESIRFVNSGTEATMTALRLARGATKRSKIIKFSGCYHGHSDLFLQRKSGVEWLLKVFLGVMGFQITQSLRR